ncbi:serine hydrolase domain-containing protein [Marispirochaeta sp.]|uniref:serine hydrolase domain-containing protein n=1 Tax=Marispirochaeta sp. TaxID=2038653 RepID=UPI0029C8CF8E|nr:serine hydrolase domain-containing protein [Marispirochaeta sp.]
MKRFLLSVVATAVAVALFSCTVAPAQRAAEGCGTREAVEHLIQERIDQTGITGLTAAVVHNGEPVVVRGFGARDGEGNPVTEDTLFQIGSVTKIITALAVMNLVEEGVIDLEADVRDYMPEFRPQSLGNTKTAVTVRDLLTHHSGLPSAYLKDFILDRPSADAFMNTSRRLSREYLVWDPGTVFAYNNVGFSLLGELVATVSGTSYGQYITETIFEPFGMENARVYLSDLENPKVSGGFTDGEPEDLSLIKDVPAGSVLLSAKDMRLFLEKLLASAAGTSDALLEPETLRSMFVPQNGDNPLDDAFEIGLTFWIDSLGGTPMYGHGGTLPPFYAEMRLIPGEDLGIFLVSNDNAGDNFVLTPLIIDIANLLTTGKAGPESAPETRPSTAMERSTLDGHYVIGGLGMASLETRKDELIASIPAIGVDTTVTFRTDNSIALGTTGLVLKPSHVEEAAFFCYMDHFYLGPVTPVSSQELSLEWQERTGRYTVEGQFFETIEFSYDEAAWAPVLNVETDTGEWMKLALTTLNDTLLQVQGIWPERGQYYRVSCLRIAGDSAIRGH